MPFIPESSRVGSKSTTTDKFRPDSGGGSFRPSSGGNDLFGTIESMTDEDKKMAAVGAVMDRSKGILGKFADFTEKIGGSLGGILDETVKTVGGAGVSGVNLAGAVGKAISGDAEGAGEMLSKERNIPILGKTTPLFTGEEKFGEAAGKMITGGLEVGGLLPTGKIATMGKKAVFTIGGEAKKLIPTLQKTTAKVSEKLIDKPVNSAIKALTLTAEEMGKSQTVDALKSGLGEAGGVIKRMAVDPSKEVLKLATDLKDVIKSKNPVRNIKAMRDAIVREDTKVGNALRNIKITISPKELKATIKKSIGDITDLTANQKLVAKMKDQIVENMMEEMKATSKFVEDGVEKSVKSFKGTLEGIWEGRKKIDKIARERINAFGGSPTLRKEIVAKSRDAIQDFIQKKIDKANIPFDYKASMKKMAEMYDAIDIFAVKAEKKMGTSALERLLDDTFSIIANPVSRAVKKILIK